MPGAGPVDGIVSLLRGLPDWQATVLVVAGSLSAALLVEFVGVGAARAVVGRTDRRLDGVLVEELRLPVVVTAGLMGVWVFVQVPEAAAVLTGDALDRFFGRPSLTVLVVVWARAFDRVLERAVAEFERANDREFAPVLTNVVTLVTLVGAAYAVLSVWQVDVTPLLGAAGIVGVAVGVAAKDPVANFFGGLALYVDDTYDLGDYIVFDDDRSGTVVDVGVRSTTLVTRDDVLVTVPNSVLNSTAIVNHSAPDRHKRLRIPVGVAYGTDPEEFEELVLGIAAEEKRVLERPAPRMHLTGFGDSALNYELRCWVASPGQEVQARHRLNRALYDGLREAGVEIPYPRRDVAIRGDLPEPAPDGPDADANVDAAPRSEATDAEGADDRR